MVRINKFITEDDVNYYKNMSNNEIKELVEKNFQGHREIIGLPDGDIDLLLEQFREKNFTEYRRKAGWNYSSTNVQNNYGKVKKMDTRTAKFDFVNKWNQEEGWYQKYRIIVDDDKKILWMGRYDDKQYFVSVGEKLYEIQYKHKYLILFPNMCSDDNYFDEENNDKNDVLIRKYFNNMGTTRFGSINDAKDIFHKEKIRVSISLEEHFEKGFFYKGFKWNKYWEEYHGYDYITILIDINVKNGLFYIEIENITYPFYGYLVLDMDKFEIIEAKKM
jgi:hypothetical protein